MDIVEIRQMNSTNTNVGSWPASDMRKYDNGDFYNKLPSDLKNAIADTTVISSHGSTSGEINFTSTDKIYLLSAREIWPDSSRIQVSERDTTYNSTRQLDYYSSKGVTTSNYDSAIKQFDGTNVYWWLRSAYSSDSTEFFDVRSDGVLFANSSTGGFGFAPAFRIG